MAAVMTETTTQARGGVPAEVDAALRIWGTWRPRTPAGPAGYPTRSPFVRAMIYGKLGVSSTHSTTTDDDAAPGVVQEMERIVVGMPDELAAVICMQYRDCFDSIGNEFSYDKKAALCSMSVSTYRNRLESARWFVFARMYPS